MQIHDYRVCRRGEGSFFGTACGSDYRTIKARIVSPEYALMELHGTETVDPNP